MFSHEKIEVLSKDKGLTKRLKSNFKKIKSLPKDKGLAKNI